MFERYRDVIDDGKAEIRGKGGAMLSEELLKVIQADRAREIAAAERVRWLRRDEPNGAADAGPTPVVARPLPAARRGQTGTGSTVATDPCV